MKQLKNSGGEKLKWRNLDASDCVEDFPRFSLDDLMDLTLGVYQLKQANSYTIEHLDFDSSYHVKVVVHEKSMFRAQIQLRHANAVLYHVWINYNTDTVLGWYCMCKVGTRILGCCAHVFSLIWYLAYARYDPSLPE